MGVLISHTTVILEPFFRQEERFQKINVMDHFSSAEFTTTQISNITRVVSLSFTNKNGITIQRATNGATKW